MPRNNLARVLALLAWLSALPALSAQWTQDKVRPSAGEPSAAFSPDSRSLALLDGKGVVRIWDVATGKEKKKLPLTLGPNESAEQLRYTPGGELAVVLCRYQGFSQTKVGTISACLWNLSTGKR